MDDGLRWYFQSAVGASHAGAIGTGEVKARLSGPDPGNPQLTTADGTSRSLEEVRRWIAETGGGREAPMVAAPEGLEIVGEGPGLRLRWPWRHGHRPNRMAMTALAGMAAFALCTSVVLAVLGLHVPGFITVAALLTLGLGYPALALYVNATELALDGRMLSVRHGPLKSWRRNRRLSLGDIRELFVHGDHDHWSLNARDGTGTHVLLVAPAASRAIGALRALVDALAATGHRPLASASGAERIARLLGMVEGAPVPAAVSRGTSVPSPVATGASGSAAREEMDRSGLVVERRGEAPHGTLTVIRPWRSTFGLVVFLGTVAFGALLLAVFLAESGLSDPARLLAVLLVLAASAYVPIALAFNRTHFTCAGGTLVIRHEPLPWPGGSSLPLEGIAQIYVRRHVELDQTNKNPYYVLEALTEDGRTLRLWKFNANLVSTAKVRAVEAELEGFLGLADRPVEGEAREA